MHIYVRARITFSNQIIPRQYSPFCSIIRIYFLLACAFESIAGLTLNKYSAK